jgi:diguanylate cyclase (GGDEF)-like protein
MQRLIHHASHDNMRRVDQLESFWPHPDCRKAMWRMAVFLLILALIQLAASLLPAWPDAKGVPDYLLLHTLMETTSIVISMMVFAIGWNSHSRALSGNIIVLACVFFSVGLLDFSHMMSYLGMPDFVSPNDAQKQLNFWLSARFLAAVALLVVAIRERKPLSSKATRYLIFGLLIFGTLIINWAVVYHQHWFPDTFIPGRGLTQFKKIAEYVLVAINLTTAAILLETMRRAQPIDVVYLFGAVCTLAMSEYFFTLYTTMVGSYNVLGHIYKTIAYLMIYRAIVVEVIDEPYDELLQTQRHLSLSLQTSKQAEQNIQQLANFDVLTGLPNRLLFKDRVEQAISQAKRNNAHLALLFSDLDHFKDINDTLGHQVGDQILVAVSKRLKSAVRDMDTPSRMGGDEFMLLLPTVDASGAARVANKLLESLANPYAIGQSEIVLTPSIGIAMYPEDGEDFETLYRHADAAMYSVKQHGRNSYHFFTQEMQSQTIRTVKIENALRHAIERDELYLHYQPQLNISGTRVVGLEALLRWQHPELGNISPAEFVPIAEKSGQIIKIGEWVLRTAVQQLKTLFDGGAARMIMAVNLSAVQFRHHDLPGVISQILEQAQLPPQYLELELTEGVTMDDPERAIHVMDDLHERGVCMSIDDFGTGYSSLNYLKKFKIYKLKIDQSFVRDITTDENDKAIVAAIILMSHSLGFQTIAEGVETAEQLAFLRECGCDEIQGYYFSKPLPAEQLVEFVNEHSLRQNIS